MALTAYKRKRDFKRTSEPPGTSNVATADYPRFVIQKHDARRLHYDLRLEIDGTFKSWAVTRGPSRDPAEKRLAVEVEDHPLDYGDFEGTIPQGEYGGGTVMVWDRGFWSADNGDPADALRRGELKLTFGGEKIKGSYVLVRMARDRNRQGHVNWLLIKHADEWAKAGDGEGLLKRDRSAASGRTMKQISAGKGSAPKPFIARTAGTDATKSRAAPAEVVPPPVVADEAGRVAGIRISHPDRIIWPEDVITKLDLALYFATVGPWMLPHIEKRPCSILRAPDGLSGQAFFQRHLMAGMSKEIAPYPVRGESEPYLKVDTTAGIVALAQFGTIEIHPWNSAESDAELPGRLVFDIDPAPEVEFARVIAAARELKKRLEALGLVTFCKTTGGKGLHVVTPLEGGKRVKWDDAKTFAHTICQQMAEAKPDLYLTNMSKSKRVGRIFLDYLRNERTATAVAPLSPRAREGATVSMPLNWSQVRSGLDPKRYTVRTAPRLLNISKAWSNYAVAGRPLELAIRKLVEQQT